ncbi:MAG: NADP-dependent oxidoreductase [Panacagrimonas sp.]
MPQSSSTNRRFVLAQHTHPRAEPAPENFRLETVDVPTPGPNQVLLRTLWLSLDPYMRVRLNEADTYMPAVKKGEVMVGGTVSRVEVSNHPDYKVGEWVHSYAGWQDYTLSDGSDIIVKLPEKSVYPSWYLGSLGMPGFTAWHSLMNIGKPKAGETFVVAAATGAVGQIIGQLAKSQGCRVVGIAGGPRKCDYAVRELGFDACVDHGAADFPAQLEAACPQGIDIYLENVGGAVFDAVQPLLNLNARIPVCGLIAHYSGGGMEGRDRLPGVMADVLFKRIKIEGFIIFDAYPQYYAQFLKEVTPLVESGTLRIREDLIDGLEGAPRGLIDLLKGGNFGKVVVKVA